MQVGEQFDVSAAFLQRTSRLASDMRVGELRPLSGRVTEKKNSRSYGELNPGRRSCRQPF
jgi:hypothetical protein